MINLALLKYNNFEGDLCGFLVTMIYNEGERNVTEVLHFLERKGCLS
ncbi:hypothetical protein WDC_0874 [Paucilactobacillus wasatchensis]|uniref:Uncharacterized protein n=1 Tax=Paucilactobacillus wasatchensis TaxID=1335616 RepID=A0A0D1A731_9LACO|nr:hypothetical protein WDC_0874 [Paucilactobacillus wasatchensis]